MPQFFIFFYVWYCSVFTSKDFMIHQMSSAMKNIVTNKCVYSKHFGIKHRDHKEKYDREIKLCTSRIQPMYLTLFTCWLASISLHLG